MNKTEISHEKLVELAAKAGFESNPFSDVLVRHSNGSWVGVEDELTKFARLLIDEIENPKPDADGWIEWAGTGACPVLADKVVEVRFRNGSCVTGRAGAFGWEHEGEYEPIIAYRVMDED